MHETLMIVGILGSVILVILIPIFGIWFIFEMFERLGEYSADRKTKRRYHDFENTYFDYNLHIWVTKYVPEKSTTDIIEDVK